MKIGVDLLGSDTPPSALLEGVEYALAQLPAKATVVCFGASPLKKISDRLQWVETNEEIRMEDPPLEAVRHKRNSSLHLGIEALKKGEIDAFITAGNTGALTALASIRLALKEGVDRPCLLATLPTMSGETAMVDVGASTQLDPEHLLQFTTLGVDFLRKVKKIEHPKVALLNIGVESMKGTAHHRQLFDTLKKREGDFVFVGNIEGKELFQGVVDLVVTDGFTGNVFLKAAEGMADFLLREVKNSVDPETFSRLKSRFTQEVSPGALLLGVNELILKCHGLSNAATLSGAILRAYHFISSAKRLEC